MTNDSHAYGTGGQWEYCHGITAYKAGFDNTGKWLVQDMHMAT